MISAIPEIAGSREESFSAARLVRGLRARFSSLADLEAYSRPPAEGQPYGRVILFKDEQCEVMLARWRPGATCAPHDHGASSGLVWFARGEFVEHQFDLEPGAGLTEQGAARVIREGEEVDVRDGDIHSCHSTGEGLSVHVYSPPVTQMKVYDRGQRDVLVVSDDCGAWVPADPQQILSREKW
jgi:predicted metal-dependent enzyme (double-stranded beta helix superfamily)